MKPDVVETAVLHIMEADANTSEMRLAAMHQINPLHTFMFNSRGKLLNANAAAIAACETPGEASLSCKRSPAEPYAYLAVTACDLLFLFVADGHIVSDF